MNCRACGVRSCTRRARTGYRPGHVTVSPVIGLVTAVRLIVPAKLNVLVKLTDIAEPVAPELKFTGVPTEIVKSPTWTVETAE